MGNEIYIGYMDIEDLADIIVDLIENRLQLDRVINKEETPTDKIFFNVRRLQRNSNKNG